MDQQILDENEVGSYTADGGPSNNAKTNNNFGGLFAAALRQTSLTVAAGDFAPGGGAQTFDVLALDAHDAIVVDAWTDLGEAFAGGGISAVTVQIGQDAGPDTDAYVKSHSLFTGAAGRNGFFTSHLGVDRVPATRQPILAAGQKVTATFTATSDDLDAAETGSVTIHVLYRLLGD